MHITMITRNAKGETIQCVIDSSRKADFEALGFVDHDSKLKTKAEVTKPKVTRQAKPKTETVKDA